jgi:hypothetical protein
MRLVRRTPPNHGQNVDRYSASSKMLKAHIDKFGTGTSNFSMFWVEIEWSDVEAIIKEFANAKNPQALRVQKAVNLLNAVEDAVSK